MTRNPPSSGLTAFRMMLLVLAYLANGFFLGHLYRDAVHSVSSELRAAAKVLTSSRLLHVLAAVLLRGIPVLVGHSPAMP